jgi:glucokinase
MFLGIEIGGTKLQLGVGRGDGSPFVALERRDIESRRGAATILEQIRSAALPLIAAHGVRRIGFGFGGPIDSAAGVVTTSHQVEGWDGFPLVDWCRGELGVPAILGNDCDAAAVAEARFGAGRGSRTVFFVTVGTGVGGGLVIDGRLHGGGRPASAEIGHLRPHFGEHRETTVESLASGPGIEGFCKALLACAPSENPKIAKERADLMDRAGGEPQRVTAKLVAEAARDGNGIAQEAFQIATGALGWAIAQVVTLLAPETVVIGGGVSLAGEELFFEPVRAAAAAYVFGPLAGSYRIVPAKLGEEVVVHGALALAAEAGEHSP